MNSFYVTLEMEWRGVMSIAVTAYVEIIYIIVVFPFILDFMSYMTHKPEKFSIKSCRI